MQLKLELVVVPVTDVDAAKAYYRDGLGFVEDHDVRPADGVRVVQLTPPGSACSVSFGTGLPVYTEAPPGSVKGLHLVVPDIAAARAAVEATGMRTVTEFERIGVVVASGTADQIEAARTQPGVTYLEGNTPIEFHDQTSNVATRGAEAIRTFTGADGQKLDGRGVSVAVIDSGIDPTHPYLRNEDGSSAVVANLKSVCLVESNTTPDCVVPVPGILDTYTISGGGHGTLV